MEDLPRHGSLDGAQCHDLAPGAHWHAGHMTCDCRPSQVEMAWLLGPRATREDPRRRLLGRGDAFEAGGAGEDENTHYATKMAKTNSRTRMQ